MINILSRFYLRADKMPYGCVAGQAMLFDLVSWWPKQNHVSYGVPGPHIYLTELTHCSMVTAYCVILVWHNNGLVTSQECALVVWHHNGPKMKTTGCRKEGNERGWLLFSYVSQFLLFCALQYSLQPSETVPSQVGCWLEKSKFLA